MWRLYELYLCRKTADGFEKIYDFPIANTGEWECAFKINGTPDFHGGFHGYEHFTAVSFLPGPDGAEFVQESEIYLQGTRRELVALHRKQYLFQQGVLRLNQSLAWQKELFVSRRYLAMLPIRRREGDFLITDTARYQGVDYDVSREGHQTILSPGCRENIGEITILGKHSGIKARVSVDFENCFFIQNTPAYNKLYFNYASDGQVKRGDCWETSACYAFSYHP